MDKDLPHTILLGAAFLLLFASAEGLYHYGKVKAEISRKYVHMVTGFITLLFPVLLSSHWYVLFLCASFAVILTLSRRYNFLQSINAIDRDSLGSISYPVSVYGCFLVYTAYGSYSFFYMPILTLAIADPLAALTGKKWPVGKYRIAGESKTIMGSSMFFIAAFLTAITCLRLTTAYGWGLIIDVAFIAAALSAATEAVTKRGLDNITIPLSVLVILVTMHLLNI